VALLVLPAFLPARLDATESPFEHGDYLINGIVACGNCHTPQGPDGPLPGMELAGGLVIEEPELTVVTPNITQDLETGIGGWSDQEIITAIREGRRPDGSIIGPPMPINLYRAMSDGDVEALVAYLRAVPPRSD
jgi:mono/diheme cytochrome c family protein